MVTWGIYAEMIGAKALLIINNTDEDVNEINLYFFLYKFIFSYNKNTIEQPKIPGLLLDKT